MPRKKREQKIDENVFKIKPENKAARRWLWISVACIMAIIVGMWAWSFKIMISNLNWHKSFESNLISGGQNDWNKLFGENESAPEIKTQLSEALKQIIQAASSTPEVATGTEMTNSSTLNTTTTN